FSRHALPHPPLHSFPTRRSSDLIGPNNVQKLARLIATATLKGGRDRTCRWRSRRNNHPCISLVISDGILVLKRTSLLYYPTLRRPEELQRAVSVHKAIYIIRSFD